MDELDERQKGIFDISIDSSHLIMGPPGSGKTNLLLLRATQLVRSGKPNVLILVFTRTLKEFLATGGKQYAFGTDRIQTLSHWANSFIRANGYEVTKCDSFEEQRQSQARQIRDILDSHHIRNEYDAIVLDEAQDYTAEELDLFFRLGSVVFAAGDERQTIYSLPKPKSKSSQTELTRRFGESVYWLKYHYRNGQKICQVADSFAARWSEFAPLLPTSNYDEQAFPSVVNITDCPTIEHQVDTAVTLLNRQIKAYPEEFLGVLCPNNKVLNQVWSRLTNSSLADLAFLESSEKGYVGFNEAKPICVCTIHGAKGLEFRAVHLMSIESIQKAALLRQLIYTGTTRAKSSLSYYHSGTIMPFIESALTVLRPPVPVAKLEQLFGGK